MVFSFISSCWRYFHSEDYALEEELPCEEEEEEDTTCWVIGEILLVYCLVIALLRMLHHGLEQMHENSDGRILMSGSLVKSPKGGKDGSRKGSRLEVKGAARCACCCRFGICGILRKLFGEPERTQADSLHSSVSLERRPSKRLSRLSQQTFCDSGSMVSGSRGSCQASGRSGRTEDNLNISSQKEGKTSQSAGTPGCHWTREQPCLRCKAKRTKEWLAKHFFEEDLPPQESQFKGDSFAAG